MFDSKRLSQQDTFSIHLKVQKISMLISHITALVIEYDLTLVDM